MAPVREVQAGVWHWEAPHPEWDPGEKWDHRMVSSYAIEDGDRLLLATHGGPTDRAALERALS